MELSFLYSPLGFVFFAMLFFVALSHLRTTRASLLSHRKTSVALMTAGKMASRKTVTLLLEVRRKASQYDALVEHLGTHGADTTLLAVVYQTAGPNAAAGMRKSARRAGVSLKVVSYKKGLSLESIVRRAPAPYVLRVTAFDRLSKRFAEFISYGFATNISALQVSQFGRTDQSLTSAFESVLSVIQNAYRRNAVSVSAGTLPHGVVVRKSALLQNEPLLATRFLSDEFAVFQPVELQTDRTQAAVQLSIILASIVLVGAILIVTPIDMLVFIGVLLGLVLWMSGALTVSNIRAIPVQQKTAFIAVVPFLPLYGIIRVIRSLLQK